MNDHVNNLCAQENYSLQQRVLSIHLDHFGDLGHEIPATELQFLISPTRHGKSARPKVFQGDGSDEPTFDYKTY